jgi:hypothetical protein
MVTSNLKKTLLSAAGEYFMPGHKHPHLDYQGVSHCGPQDGEERLVITDFFQQTGSN